MVRIRKQLVMLANVLAVLLGFGSFIFYTVAFLYPEVHRRSDWVWSGLGLMYAVDLWFSAEQMTPAVLLGQVVSVTLLAGLGWQTLTVRREKTPVYQQTPIVLTPEIVGGWAKSKLNQLRIAPAETVRPATLKDRPVASASTERLRQGLNQSLDPRKRPLYDYEFVEDGILESTPTEPEISAEALEMAAVESEPIDPPSAIAQIIAIQTDEPGHTDSLQAETPDPSSSQPEASEQVSKLETSELETSEPKVSESRASGPESVETAAIESIEASADDGADDWNDDWDDSQADNWNSELESRPQAATEQIKTLKPEGQSQQNPAKNNLVREKPSVLAMPIIFIGWLKDVVQSMTKPKPSKPVIDIPRRGVPFDRTDIETGIEIGDDESNWID